MTAANKNSWRSHLTFYHILPSISTIFFLNPSNSLRGQVKKVGKKI